MRQTAERRRRRTAYAVQPKIIDPIAGYYIFGNRVVNIVLYSIETVTHTCASWTLFTIEPCCSVSSTQLRQRFASAYPGYLQYRDWCSVEGHHLLTLRFERRRRDSTVITVSLRCGHTNIASIYNVYVKTGGSIFCRNG